jgi:hypothetical protein
MSGDTSERGANITHTNRDAVSKASWTGDTFTAGDAKNAPLIKPTYFDEYDRYI